MKTVVLVLTLSLVAFFASAGPAASMDCTNTTLTGVIDGNVSVPSGAYCTIGNSYLGAKITGNVLVGQNATLVVQARQYPSTIEGNILATGCSSALLEGAVTVGGNVQISQCQNESGFVGPGVKISGNLLNLTDTTGISTINVPGSPPSGGYSAYPLAPRMFFVTLGASL